MDGDTATTEGYSNDGLRPNILTPATALKLDNLLVTQLPLAESIDKRL